MGPVVLGGKWCSVATRPGVEDCFCRKVVGVQAELVTTMEKLGQDTSKALEGPL